MIYINRKPKADYSTVVIGKDDFVDGLSDYMEENRWIYWVPGNRTLQIHKDEPDLLLHLQTFITWVSDKGHEVSIRNDRVDEWEEPKADDYLERGNIDE